MTQSKVAKNKTLVFTGVIEHAGYFGVNRSAQGTHKR
jgi:hypothetical protein